MVLFGVRALTAPPPQPSVSFFSEQSLLIAPRKEEDGPCSQTFALHVSDAKVSVQLQAELVEHPVGV